VEDLRRQMQDKIIKIRGMEQNYLLIDVRAKLLGKEASALPGIIQSNLVPPGLRNYCSSCIVCE
jgi:hypothetical protein